MDSIMRGEEGIGGHALPGASSSKAPFESLDPMIHAAVSYRDQELIYKKDRSLPHNPSSPIEILPAHLITTPTIKTSLSSPAPLRLSCSSIHLYK